MALYAPRRAFASLPRYHSIIAVLASLLLASIPAAAWAEGEHSRRAAAELEVLRGDLRKLEQGAAPEKQKNGLKARILGVFSGLPLMLRLADEEVGRDRQTPPPVDVFRELLQQGSFDKLSSELVPFGERYPFQARGILPATATTQRLELASRIHVELCAGCHDSPYLQQERPPFNLFRQAAETPALEFAARMVVGIRGDRVTGLDNPFSDEELAALIAYYRNGAR